MTKASLRMRVHKNDRLRALYMPGSAPKPPQEAMEVADRDMSELPEQVPVGDRAAAEAVRKQDIALVRLGLQEAGLKADTINLLAKFDDFAPSVGRFLGATLDISHKMMFIQTSKLFEEAEYIREHYLHNQTLRADIRLEWQKVYNEICDLLGKTYDRTLNGTQTLAKLMAASKAGKEKGQGKSKPGFEPLKKVN